MVTVLGAQSQEGFNMNRIKNYKRITSKQNNENLEKANCFNEQEKIEARAFFFRMRNDKRLKRTRRK